MQWWHFGLDPEVAGGVGVISCSRGYDSVETH
jgi:hypothetical protein